MNYFSIIFIIVLRLNISLCGNNFYNHYYVSNTGNDKNIGSIEKPFRDINTTLKKLSAGDTLTIQGGEYKILDEIIISVKGQNDAWIVIEGDTTQPTIINASDVNIKWQKEYPGVRGSIQIEYSSFVHVRNLTLRNNHMAGINIKESNNIDVVNCLVENSYASGISAWQKCNSINILGNSVINANNRELYLGDFVRKNTPHEAISIAGVNNFEVAFNLVENCKKEGIDVKEISSHGVVHHNYVINCNRQGLYVDAWFGVLEDIEFHHNIVTQCEGGFAISSENGELTEDIRFHHNLIFENRGVGIYFSRWGKDNLRKKIYTYNNTLYHNGYGQPHNGYKYYWLCGGLYLYSTIIDSIVIEKNIFAENYPFEIGISTEYNNEAIKKKNIVIKNNLIYDKNNFNYPIYLAEWTKDSVNSVYGDSALLTNPQFIDPGNEDFRTSLDNKFYGAFVGEVDDWWRNNFPPKIELNKYKEE